MEGRGLSRSQCEDDGHFECEDVAAALALNVVAAAVVGDSPPDGFSHVAGGPSAVVDVDGVDFESVLDFHRFSFTFSKVCQRFLHG